MQVEIQDKEVREIAEKVETIRDLAFAAEKGGDVLNYASYRIRTISGQIAASLKRMLEKAEEEKKNHVYLQY